MMSAHKAQIYTDRNRNFLLTVLVCFHALRLVKTPNPIVNPQQIRLISRFSSETGGILYPAGRLIILVEVDKLTNYKSNLGNECCAGRIHKSHESARWWEDTRCDTQPAL